MQLIYHISSTLRHGSLIAITLLAGTACVSAVPNKKSSTARHGAFLHAEPHLSSDDNRTESSRKTTVRKINYALGKIDPRFGVSKDRLLKIIREATRVWEKPVGDKIFTYDPTSDLKINLRFDERQKAILEAKLFRSSVVSSGKTIEEVEDTYKSQVAFREKLSSEYKRMEAGLNRKIHDYNTAVQAWNERAEDPASEESRSLVSEKADLELEQTLVLKKLDELNKSITVENDLARNLNELADQHNLVVQNYNDRFGSPRQFEKGVYNGRAINLYEFQDEDDLRITLVHELGHVLGFGHVENPNAVMYHILEKQNIRAIALTDDDLELLFRKFPRSSKSL